MYFDGALFPQYVEIAPLIPASILLSKQDVEIPYQPGQYQTHFRICEAVEWFKVSSNKTDQAERRGTSYEMGFPTHFFPMQFRGPIEKGRNPCLLSLAKRGSPSQRSGMNSSGWVKYAGL